MAHDTVTKIIPLGRRRDIRNSPHSGNPGRPAFIPRRDFERTLGPGDAGSWRTMLDLTSAYRSPAPGLQHCGQ
ncbi:MAG: hypothetical protein ACJ72M_03735 [Propionibacteriaceae bacterium]